MSIGTVHGRVGSTPGQRPAMEYIDRVEAVNATGIKFLFGPLLGQFQAFEVHVDGVEANVNACNFAVNVSIDGANIAVGAVSYNYTTLAYGATTAVAATGNNGNSLMGVGAANLLMATATGYSGGGIVRVLHPEFSGPHCFVEWDLHFANSASMPFRTIGTGWHSTATIVRGIGISSDQSGNYKAINATLFGIRHTR
jgi:hypothetical protein